MRRSPFAQALCTSGNQGYEKQIWFTGRTTSKKIPMRVNTQILNMIETCSGLQIPFIQIAGVFFFVCLFFRGLTLPQRGHMMSYGTQIQLFSFLRICTFSGVYVPYGKNLQWDFFFLLEYARKQHCGMFDLDLTVCVKFHMLFQCPCGFHPGSPVSSHLSKTWTELATFKLFYKRFHTVFWNELASHPGCVPTSCAEFPGEAPTHYCLRWVFFFPPKCWC